MKRQYEQPDLSAEQHALSEKEKIEATAILAERDIEERLDQLRELADARRKDPVREKTYTELRDELSTYLHKNGPRYFRDEFGDKYYAWSVNPEPLVVDVKRLEELVARGELPMAVLDKVTERKVIAEEFRKACSTGEIDSNQLLYTSHLGRATPFVQIRKEGD